MSRKPQPLTPELLGRVAELLEGESTLTLSVSDVEGHPHAAPVFYVTGTGEGPRQLDLLWLSSPASLHSVCLAGNPQAAVAIHRPTFRWQEIAGVQMRGVCSIVDGEEREAALRRYRERFQLGSVLGLAIRQSTLYRFRPTWVRLTDNREGFGWKAEFLLQTQADS
jgi:hypothetical protein